MITGPKSQTGYLTDSEFMIGLNPIWNVDLSEPHDISPRLRIGGFDLNSIVNIVYGALKRRGCDALTWRRHGRGT